MRRFLIAVLAVMLPSVVLAQTVTQGTPSGFVTVAMSGTQVSHTGDTNEFTFATVTLPANSMGANGQLRITALWSFTASTNAKTMRVKFGDTYFAAPSVSTTGQQSYQDIVFVRNRNNTASQVGGPANYQGTGASTGALVTAAVDTTAAVTILFTGQLASSGETVSLEGYSIESVKSP